MNYILSRLITILSVIVIESDARVNISKCATRESGGHNSWYSDGYSETCYGFIKYPRMNNERAENYCNKFNASLVSIHTNIENELVLSLVEQLGDYYSKKVWIGLNRNLEAGIGDRWLDGTYVDYVNWNQTQLEKLEHCAYMETDNHSYKGKWFYHNCGETLTAICKTWPKNKASSTNKPEVKGHCEDGWVRYGVTCYLINKAIQDWESSVSDCRTKYNGQPVSIHSMHQQAFITVFAGRAEMKQLWLGAHRDSSSFSFIWKSNLAFDYSNWLPGHPQYYNDGVDCVRINFENNLKVGGWESVACDLKLPSICQKMISPKNMKPSNAVFPVECPNNVDYFKYVNACFKISDARYSWNDAQEVCTKEGGTLVSLADEYEHSFLTVLQQGKGDVWIGLKGVKDEYEKFNWIDDTHLYFTNWDRLSNTNETQCVYQTESGLWRAATKCDDTKAFACKIHLGNKPQPKVHRKICPKANVTNEILSLNRWVDLDPELDFCYQYESEVGDFGSARLNCYQKGGDLLSIHSEHEMKLLSDFVKPLARKRYSLKFWIGLHRTNTEGFKWTDNTPVEFFSWAEEGDTGRQCVIASSTLDQWKTSDCSMRSEYICAVLKDTLPEAKTANENQRGMSTLVKLLIVTIVVGFIVFSTFFAFVLIQRRRVSILTNIR